MTKRATTRKTRAAKNASTRKPQKSVQPPGVDAFYQRAGHQAAVARGTLSGDFAWAVESSPDMATRLRRFLKQYKPADGEFQDGFHKSRVRAAQLELMRLEYLKGNVKAGDRLLAQLEDAGQ